MASGCTTSFGRVSHVGARKHYIGEFISTSLITSRFAVDWLPAGVVGISGLPSVWGPVGGAAPFPWALRKWLSWRSMFGEAVRFSSGGIGRTIFGNWAAHKASVVVAQNYEVRDRFSSRNPHVEPNAALPKRDGKEQPSRSGDGRRPMAIFVGRLVGWKGIRLAIATIAQPSLSGWRLEVFGDGPELSAATSLARQLGVEESISFRGLRPREEVLAAYANADAMLFPTMHDSAPWAVAEAIVAGLPVICLDRCGPAVMIERTGGGTAVPCDTNAPESLARALQEAGSGVRTALRRFKPDR